MNQRVFMETYFHLFKYPLVSGLQGQWELLIQRLPSGSQGCSVCSPPRSLAEHRDSCPKKGRSPAPKTEGFHEFSRDSKVCYWFGAGSSSHDLLLSSLRCLSLVPGASLTNFPSVFTSKQSAPAPPFLTGKQPRPLRKQRQTVVC